MYKSRTQYNIKMNNNMLHYRKWDTTTSHAHMRVLGLNIAQADILLFVYISFTRSITQLRTNFIDFYPNDRETSAGNP